MELRDHYYEDTDRPAGYAAMVAKYDLQAPLKRMTTVSPGRVKGNRRVDGAVTLLDNRFWPGDSDTAHLEFAIRYEPLDLLLLKKSFEAIDPNELAAFVAESPLAISTRRLWFFYEWLTGTQLPLSDLGAGAPYVDALDSAQYYTLADGTFSKRHRVRDNLPGTPAYCALARRSDAPDRAPELAVEARRVVEAADPNTVRRAAAFMLLKDSKASFEIEGETPSQKRLERWAKCLSRAGRQPLSLDLLTGLQREVLGEQDHIALGLRTAGVWLGDRDRDHNPVPDAIGARPDDLPSLVDGMIAADRLQTSDKGFNPIVHAAGLAFGFVYVHPLGDGNGRLHRYLINHALAADKFSPDGIVFPVAAEILKNVGEYSEILGRNSLPQLDFIEWRADEHRNVEVLNDTGDLYRFPDVTEEAEFLARCVAATVEHTLPDEIAFLEAYDKSIRGVAAVAEMPNNLLSLLVIQTINNGGSIPKKRRKNEYKHLDDAQVERIENLIRDAFNLPPLELEEEAAPSFGM